MASSRPNSYFLRGARDALPFVLVVVPFATLFGVVATEAGLSVAQTMGFSIVVIAGAAQFAALQLMIDDAPTLMIVLTALAVNLRMAMYSASLAVHLGAAPFWQRAIVAYFNVDQSYALSTVRYETEPDMTLPERLVYFFGTMTPIAPCWYIFTLVGALVGQAIPPEYALDFAVPITFLALVAPMLRTRAHLLAAGTSVVVALALAGLPFGAGLLVAGFSAMIVGAQADLWAERRSA
ncbi:MAG: AzlC family ABC transporter permease [Alphaproteobacteria bacterium]|nr:AzlC family ABC transporter permease [Alphaproteobacteria bacterium]NNF23856.1 branched-chain amino acid ABC transporter permease [Paracoccaceae bacterium]